MNRLMLFTALFALGCAPEPASPLARAIRDDNADAVQALLEQGEPVDRRDERGMTPLMWAARSDSVHVMALLIDAGADVNARDTNNQWTPLLHAIHKQHHKAVELLLARGADPNAAMPGGMTPLMMAADDPDPRMVTALLDYGGDPGIVGPAGATALTQAVSGGALSDIDRPLLGGCHPATVRALVDHEPTLTVASDAAGRSAIWWARFHGCDEVLRIVRK